ncbi:toll/interleukin-1 receptor (TIR) domain-containing protein [Artemisia annua]|uniref:Toll/interleukin-1 receptor (TIR) domain-containing protein n=1 Tax=Artemisia annua TaxID=35608 RepID=A0A2U1N6G4_ARTAN|nr:toll/interleukin-1 receptor (TIR) domain-containing protein [Artemisia annua]
MGKTTLAEVIYKEIQNSFQGGSFIENIKDVSKNNDSTNLRKLQEMILNDILKDKIRVQSVTHGQQLLGTVLRHMKVIIVLDDVNHLDQITYLAGNREWFGPGTRIMITTTNINLLDPYIINEIYICEELKGDEALRLFCQSAFKQGYPTQGYGKLSDDIVRLTGGLPLALKVYGSLLCAKKENYWIDMLKKLREYPEEEVLGRLEIVYSRLDRDQRKIFIYIACFLKGRNKNLVLDILKTLGLYPECAIPDLINKFLITINHDDSVWVHDLLQQMCWEVLRKESERNDGKHIAIKYRKDFEDIISSEPQVCAVTSHKIHKW